MLPKTTPSGIGFLLDRLRMQPAHHRFGRGVGLLLIHAPVFQLLERNGHPGHGATHEGARPDDPEIAVEKLHFGLSRHRRRAIVTVQQKYSPWLTVKTPTPVFLPEHSHST